MSSWNWEYDGMFQAPRAWAGRLAAKLGFGRVALGLAFPPWSSGNLPDPAQFPSPCLKERDFTNRHQHSAASSDTTTPVRLLSILVSPKAVPMTKISKTSKSPVLSARRCGCTQELGTGTAWLVRSETQLAPAWWWCGACSVASPESADSFYIRTTHWQMSSWLSWG